MRDSKQLCEIIARNSSNIAESTFPELKDLPLCEKLVSPQGNNDINKSGFKYKDKYLIFPTVLSGNFHFTTKLIQLWDPEKESLKLSYDPNYLGDPNLPYVPPSRSALQSESKRGTAKGFRKDERFSR